MTYVTKCTSPAAPFYKLDLAYLEMMEAFGIDLPCNVHVAIAGFTISLTIGMIAMAIAFWVWMGPAR